MSAEDTGASREDRLLLVLLGFGMLACCLFWDRISLHRAIHEPWLARLITALWSPVEALIGRIPDGGAASSERFKILTFCWALLPAMVIFLAALHQVLTRFPAGDRFAMKVTLGFAVLFRLVLAPFPPILETDPHRYLWDGAVLAHGGNPYQFAPIEISNVTSAKFRADLYSPEEIAELRRLEAIRKVGRMGEHFDRINHPTVPTIYPPASQLLFATAFLLRPGSLEIYKYLVVFIDIGILLVLLALLRRLGRNPCWILFYGWSPLMLKEYANTGHHDVLATLCVMLAVRVLLEGSSRAILGGALMGVGALAKLYPIALAVVLARRLRGRGLAAFGLVLALGYAPFVAGTGKGTFDSLGQFATGWEFNSSAYAALNQLLGLYLPEKIELSGWPPFELKVLAKTLCAIGMGLGALILMFFPLRTPHQVVGHVLAILATIFLLSPVSDPWYFGWLMPWITLMPAAHWIYLSLSTFIYYLYFWSWEYLPNARAIEYLPFYTLLIRDLASRLPSWWAARRDPC